MRLLLLWETVIMINWPQEIVSSNAVCNHLRDNNKSDDCQILLVTCTITDRIGVHSVLLPLLTDWLIEWLIDLGA